MSTEARERHKSEAASRLRRLNARVVMRELISAVEMQANEDRTFGVPDLGVELIREEIGADVEKLRRLLQRGR